jgi:hypothetical protein
MCCGLLYPSDRIANRFGGTATTPQWYFKLPIAASRGGVTGGISNLLSPRFPCGERLAVSDSFKTAPNPFGTKKT